MRIRYGSVNSRTRRSAGKSRDGAGASEGRESRRKIIELTLSEILGMACLGREHAWVNRKAASDISGAPCSAGFFCREETEDSRRHRPLERVRRRLRVARRRRQSPHPISSCETLLGLREFLPYFREQAMDVAIIDAVWNGVWQAMKIANAADAFDVNIAPHNFYGHLATMMNAHFAAATPNLRIMEIDIDRLAWDEEVFTAVPQFDHGHLIVPDTPGWGTEPIEEAIKAHPSRGPGGLLHYRQP
jgi:hypothetical protein